MSKPKERLILLRKVFCADCGCTSEVIEYERYASIPGLGIGTIMLCKLCKEGREDENDE